MKFQAKIVLLILISMYFVTRWARIHIEIPEFFRFYFTDLLFIPVQLMISLWATRFIKRDSAIRISMIWIVLQVILVSFLFEWYMPNYGNDRTRFTGDWIDVLMYVLGGIGFRWLQHWESRIQNPKFRITRDLIPR